MAEKLNIRVNVVDVDDGKQTVSKFSVAENGKVIFHNDNTEDKLLTVTFGEPHLLCRGNTPQSSITIQAGEQEQLKVCNAAAGQSFKYTAEVSGAGAEDPIVIIESATDPSVSTSLMIGLAGAVLGGGAVVGVRALRTRWKLKRHASASQSKN